MNNGYFLYANDDKGDHQLSGEYNMQNGCIFVLFYVNNVLDGPMDMAVQIELNKFQTKSIVMCV